MTRIQCSFSAAVAVVVLTTTFGCLQEPSGSGTDGAVFDGSVVVDGQAEMDGSVADSSISDATVRVDAEPVPDGDPFPPPGLPMKVVCAARGDVNGDQIDDLLVANEVTDLGTHGIFVLLGGADRQLSQYHAYLPSGEILPKALAVADFNRDGLADVAAFGPIVGESGTKLAIYLGQPGLVFDEPLLLTMSGALYGDEYRPYEVAVGQFGGDQNPDIAVANAHGVAVIHLDYWGALFSTNTISPITFNDDGRYNVVKMSATPSGTAGRDDLVIAHSQRNTLVLNGGDGTFDGARYDSVMALPGQEHAVVTDLDGDDGVDILSTGRTPDKMYGAAIVNKAGGVGYLGVVEGVYGHEVLAVVDADSDPRRDVVLLTLDPKILRLQLNIDFDDTVTPAAMTFQDTRPDAVPGVVDAKFMEVGNFDGDAVLEVYLVTVAGTVGCHEVHPSGVVPCQ